MIIRGKIKKEDLREPFVKAVVDIEKGLVSLDCELHIDCAEELIADGSRMKNLWGVNIYPDYKIDFISLINIRPAEGNRSIKIQNPDIINKIEEKIKKFL